jgi:hypothetical protein
VPNAFGQPVSQRTVATQLPRLLQSRRLSCRDGGKVWRCLRATILLPEDVEVELVALE